MSHLILNIRELIGFYDDEPGARPHSNAVKSVAGEELGLALLEQYLQETHRKPTRLFVPCTTDGAWLDGWIRVEHPEHVLYQVEVKSWSMHGYGSRKQQLSVDAAPDTLAHYKVSTWERYWQAGSFKAQGLKKTLLRMRLPKDETGPIEPIACVWAAVHPEGKEASFFTVPTKGVDFKEVHIFSMSAYLRSVMGSGRTAIVLNLPNTVKRLGYLSKLFSAPQ
jgi:hypothetical protein